MGLTKRYNRRSLDRRLRRTVIRETATGIRRNTGIGAEAASVREDLTFAYSDYWDNPDDFRKYGSKMEIRNI